MAALPLLMVLIMASSLGHMAADIYLPSLPSIALDFGVSDNLAQLSISIFMLGFCFSRLIYGTLSDAVGRKKPLMIGILLCLVGSTICSAANSIFVLITGRFVQGVGAAAGATLAKSILRDVVDDTKLSTFDSYLNIANILLIACAPLIGGYIQYYFNWRSNFILLTVYTIVVLLIIIFFLSESNQHSSSQNIKFGIIIQNFKMLVQDSTFVSYGLCIFFVFAGYIAWLTTGPILLSKKMGLSSVQFGWVSALVGFAFVAGSLLNGKIIARCGIQKMMTVGTSIILFAGTMLIAVSLLKIVNIYTVVIPVWVYVFGGSIIFPNAYAGCLTPFPKIAGIAVAIIGTIQVLGGFISSMIVSCLPTETTFPLAAILFICGLVSVLLIKQVHISYNNRREKAYL